MFEIMLMVLGVMVFCGVLLSPFYFLRKKKVNETQKSDTRKTIIWWKALPCGIILISFFAYLVFKSETGFTLPTYIALPYYALLAWCAFDISQRKIIFTKSSH